MRLSAWFRIIIVAVVFGSLGCVLGEGIMDLEQKSKPHPAIANNDPPGINLPFPEPVQQSAPLISGPTQ